jgi:hypothetical protein
MPITEYVLEVDEGFGNGYRAITPELFTSTQFLHTQLVRGHKY